jgi:type III secretion protein Q
MSSMLRDPGSNPVGSPSLRRMSRAEVMVRNRVVSGLRLAFEIESVPAWLTLNCCAASPVTLDRRSFTFSSSHGSLLAADGAGWLRALTAIDANAEREEEREWLARCACARVPTQVQDAFGAFTLGQRDDTEPQEVWLTAGIHGSGVGLVATTPMRAAAQSWLRIVAHPQWEAMRPNARLPLRRLPLVLPCSVGQATLDRSQLAMLRAGDIVMLATAYFDTQGRGVLFVASRYMRVRCIDGEQNTMLEFLGWEDAMVAGNTEETVRTPAGDTRRAQPAAKELANLPVQALPDNAELEPSEPLTDFAALTVTVSFDLGSIELRLDELDRLTVGSILRLNAPSPPEVSMRVNGQRVGEGDLVEVDGRLGVQIRALAQSP